MGRIIQAKAWGGSDTVALARELLGMHLVRRHLTGRVEARVITEVEAYHGESDLACHASKGRTKRTETLYAGGGVWYVYLCYGIHEMLNLVVGPPGHPAAILIRSLEGITGPGRLTRALGLDRRLNGLPATRASGLWIEDRGIRVPPDSIRASPRIGVDSAGPIWALKPWRFVLEPVRAPAGGTGRASPARRQT
jgi:DNA-3-methyladenine glycosylase